MDLRTFLSRLEALEPCRVAELSVRFLRLRPPAAERGLNYRTLPEALADGGVEIGELSGGGSIPTLRLRNRTGERVFLMGGEMLAGGKQNRTVNTDVMVEAGCDADVPVSCVERGRWRHLSKGFAPAPAATPSVRRVLTQSVTTRLRTSGRPDSDQRAVWNEVDETGTRVGSRSPTSSLSDHYRARIEEVRRVLDAVAAPDDACGILVRYGPTQRAMDVFDRAHTLRQYLRPLLEGYLIDARAPVEDDAPVEMADMLDDARTTEHGGVGLGTEVRITSARAHGGALVVAGALVHLSLIEASR